MKMRHIIKAFTVFGLAALFCLVFPLTASADGNEGSGVAVMLDDMSKTDVWGSVSGTVSYMRYTAETMYLSSGEDDTGYLSVRNNSAVTGAPLEVSRSFDTPLDLFSYNEIGFYINITDPGDGTPVSGYVVTLTLYSRGPSYSFRTECEAGEWTRVTAAIGDYSLRTDIIGISVSVTATAATEETAPGTDGEAAPPALPLRLAFRLDGISTGAPRNTSFEERFLCASFESRGGRLTIGDDAVTLAHIDGTGRLSGCPVIRGREDTDYDMIRFTVTETAPVRAVLEVTYLDGGTYTSEEKAVAVGVGNALCFRVANIGDIYSFSLSFSGEGAGELTLGGVSLLSLPDGEASGIGTLDLCRVSKDGSVKLRGSVPSETVAEYMDGKISVYCVPINGDWDVLPEDASPCAEISMTTRFDIDIPASSLPTGYRAMRFCAAITRGGQAVLISRPTLPTFADDTGARLPDYGTSIKGLMSGRDSVGSGAAMTFFDVATGDLFGTAASGRMYSFGGNVYYFDSGVIGELDTKIKTASLTGTACYIRLSPERGRFFSTDTVEGSSALYAAVDFLSQRYSSPEHGYIAGVAISSGDLSPVSGVDAARTLALTYQTGRGRISGFRVMLSLPEPFVGDGSAPDAADALLRIRSGASVIGSQACDILLETGTPLSSYDAVSSFLQSLPGWETALSFVIYDQAESLPSEPRALLSDYASIYYAACSRGRLRGLVLNSGGRTESMTEESFGEFSEYFFLLDTVEGAVTDAYTGTEPGVVPDGARTKTFFQGRESHRPVTFEGTYSIFDFSDSFDTAGWFSVGGKCSTVSAADGRAMRADTGGGVIRFFGTPRDFSAAEWLSLSAFSDIPGSFVLTLYTTSGAMRATLTLGSEPADKNIDISEFDGASSVYAISILPKDRAATVFVRGLSACSRTLGDEELAAAFSPPPEEGNGAGGGVSFEVLAIISLAVAFGIAAFAVIGYGRRERERRDG